MRQLSQEILIAIHLRSTGFVCQELVSSIVLSVLKQQFKLSLDDNSSAFISANSNRCDRKKQYIILSDGLLKFDDLDQLYYLV